MSSSSSSLVTSTEKHPRDQQTSASTNNHINNKRMKKSQDTSATTNRFETHVQPAEEVEVDINRPSGKVKFFIRDRRDALEMDKNNTNNNNNNHKKNPDDDEDEDGQSSSAKKQTATDDDGDDEIPSPIPLPDDLTSAFSPDVLCRITAFLKPRDLLHLGTTNREFYNFCKSNASGWDAFCERLWHDKIYVSQSARQNPSKILAYQESILDSKRSYITMEELCYETSKIIWSFRFKASAGTDWTSVDPWHNGRPCRKVVFLRDGRVQWVVVPTTNEDATTTSLQMDETVRFTDPPTRMTWRFLTRPMDLPSRRLGCYVRFNVGGRDVPTYAVSRSPTANWGFVMESCWGIYGSFELPPKPIQQHPLLPNHRRHQILLARRRPGEADGVVWIQNHHHNHNQNINNNNNNNNPRLARRFQDDDDEEEGAENNSINAGEDMPNNNNNNNRLLQDDTLTLTNEIQWREAFLYNVGARVLPEGDQAADEFDRAWQGL